MNNIESNRLFQESAKPVFASEAVKHLPSNWGGDLLCPENTRETSGASSSKQTVLGEKYFIHE